MAKANLKPWIFDLQNECLDLEQLHKKQWGLLEKLTHRVAHEVPFYRDAWSLLQIDPREMKSVEDFQKLPCTHKSDLREAYPLKMASVPLSQIRRLHASSGTTGNPTVVAYTASDLKIWSELVARTLAAAGVKAGTILQNAYGYGIFTGGMGFHGGAERLGAGDH